MPLEQRKPQDLTPDEIGKAVADLIGFYNFSCFAERDVDTTTGLTFATEQLAVSLGLVVDWQDGYDSAEMMIDFCTLMDRHAVNHECVGVRNSWSQLRADLPYSRAL